MEHVQETDNVLMLELLEETDLSQCSTGNSLIILIQSHYLEGYYLT